MTTANWGTLEITVRVSSSTNSKGITFYNTSVSAQETDGFKTVYASNDKDAYAYNTHSGLVVKSRSNAQLAPDFKRIIAKAVYEFEEVRKRAHDNSRALRLTELYSYASDEVIEAVMGE